MPYKRYNPPSWSRVSFHPPFCLASISPLVLKEHVKSCTFAELWSVASCSGGGSKQITSDTAIRVTLEVPVWLSFVSLGAVEATGSKVSATARGALGLKTRALLHVQKTTNYHRKLVNGLNSSYFCRGQATSMRRGERLKHIAHFRCYSVECELNVNRAGCVAGAFKT